MKSRNEEKTKYKNEFADDVANGKIIIDKVDSEIDNNMANTQTHTHTVTEICSVQI